MAIAWGLHYKNAISILGSLSSWFSRYFHLLLYTLLLSSLNHVYSFSQSLHHAYCFLCASHYLGKWNEIGFPNELPTLYQASFPATMVSMQCYIWIEVLKKHTAYCTKETLSLLHQKWWKGFKRKIHKIEKIKPQKYQRLWESGLHASSEFLFSRSLLSGFRTSSLWLNPTNRKILKVEKKYNYRKYQRSSVREEDKLTFWIGLELMSFFMTANQFY